MPYIIIYIILFLALLCTLLLFYPAWNFLFIMMPHLILILGIIPTSYYLSDDHSTFDSGNCYDLPVLKLCLPYNNTRKFPSGTVWWCAISVEFTQRCLTLFIYIIKVFHLLTYPHISIARLLKYANH